MDLHILQQEQLRRKRRNLGVGWQLSQPRGWCHSLELRCHQSRHTVDALPGAGVVQQQKSPGSSALSSQLLFRCRRVAEPHAMGPWWQRLQHLVAACCSRPLVINNWPSAACSVGTVRGPVDQEGPSLPPRGRTVWLKPCNATPGPSSGASVCTSWHCRPPSHLPPCPLLEVVWQE